MVASKRRVGREILEIAVQGEADSEMVIVSVHELHKYQEFSVLK